ncbi:hypothetical protein D3C76_1108610 [compost metagenome]
MSLSCTYTDCDTVAVLIFHSLVGANDSHTAFVQSPSSFVNLICSIPEPEPSSAYMFNNTCGFVVSGSSLLMTSVPVGATVSNIIEVSSDVILPIVSRSSINTFWVPSPDFRDQLLLVVACSHVLHTS